MFNIWPSSACLTPSSSPWQILWTVHAPFLPLASLCIRSDQEIFRNSDAGTSCWYCTLAWSWNIRKLCGMNSCKNFLINVTIYDCIRSKLLWELSAIPFCRLLETLTSSSWRLPMSMKDIRVKKQPNVGRHFHALVYFMRANWLGISAAPNSQISSRCSCVSH